MTSDPIDIDKPACSSRYSVSYGTSMSTPDERLDQALECFRCHRHPSQIDVYVLCGQDEDGISAAEYVRRNEGTLNVETGRFACDECYLAIGMPTAPRGWKAP